MLKPGRTLTVCQLEVYAVQSRGKLVANGRQTLIRVNRPADGSARVRTAVSG
ncbi:hypothetical protein ACH46N_31540 [Streptomyces pristinaespiralis]|uniref:Uncharacterized protein n=2 Tax=Streptomyces pristinaespiralis TaxID=38300 RepID=B5HA99_STRE2|nr:phenylacetic acid degradation protein PaaI [Streptomyces pristinaespiralis]EDY63760.1 conserved hypothetical protein [Streptomyces pristinaespiralis ATCC 25486]